MYKVFDYNPSLSAEQQEILIKQLTGIFFCATLTIR